MSADIRGEKFQQVGVGGDFGAGVNVAPAAQNAEWMMQSIVQMADNIEVLLAALEGASLRSRQLRERRALWQAQTTRQKPSRERFASQAAYEQAVATWGAKSDQTQANLSAELQGLNVEAKQLREQLDAARVQMQQAQTSGLSNARLQDAQKLSEHAAQEERKLDSELQGMAVQQQSHKREGRVDDKWQAAQSPVARTPTQATKLTEGTAAADNDMPFSAAEVDDSQREQLVPIVQLVGAVLRSQRGTAGRGAAKSGGNLPLSTMTAQLQSRWSEFVARMNVDQWMDVNQLIQWVVREAYVANTDDLRLYAYRVKYFTDLKRRIRDELTRARSHQSAHMETGSEQLNAAYNMLRFNTSPVTDEKGGLVPRAPEAAGDTRDVKALDTYIKELDQLLNTVGDDAQLAQVDLQNVTQKQQQTLQTLSNLSKIMHETTMAIIRKIGS